MTAATSPRSTSPRRGRTIAAFIAVLLVAYVASGTYNVAPTERGVVRFCGRVVEPNVLPGMHYAFPWPFSRIDRPKATEVRRVVVGITPEDRLLIDQGDMQAIAGSPQTDVLTGDINILKVTLVVQYQILEASKYVLRTVAPDELVRRAVQAAMVETLSNMAVDKALTTGKMELRDNTIARTRELLTAYQTGITVVSASVQKIDPPSAVSASFNDVTSAEYDKERLAKRARTAADTTVSLARNQAQERLQSARNDATRRLAIARGDTTAFLERLAEYEKSPDITRQRLWLETMERVYSRARKFILDEKQGDGPIQLNLLDAETPVPPQRNP